MDSNGTNKMSLYSDERQQENLAIMRKTMVSMPMSSNIQMQKVLKSNGYAFTLNYISKLKKKIKNERALRYDRQTKAAIVAEFEDFINDLEPKLRVITAEGKNHEKIEAIRTLVFNYKQLIELQMDLGVLERNLGTIRTENYHFDIVKLAKLVEKVNKDKENDRGNNYIGVDQ